MKRTNTEKSAQVVLIFQPRERELLMETLKLKKC